MICDNASSHKTALVQTWLLLSPNVHIHYTPTYSSWLNQVETWFAKIQRDAIARGIFPSTQKLDNKIMRSIREHNRHSKPIQWK